MRVRPGVGMKALAAAAGALALYAMAASPLAAEGSGGEKGALPDLAALKAMEAPAEAVDDKERAAKRRGEAQRLAALSWATQAGLAHRGGEIAALLEKRAKHLSQTFDFRALMLNRGGFLVMPPVLGETRDAIRITDRMAASARRVLRISAGGRIMGAPPTWREWLEREWEPARRPSPVLFPRDEAERERWDAWLEEGWARGVQLANDIYESDLERLEAAFVGVVRWHRLHQAAMVSAPETQAEHTAVSGHERLMRIGETVVRLDERARFNLAPREWKPAPEPAERE